MIPFPFNENRFSFFVADHLLVGQLCTNPKSDRSLLSCLKVTQCSTSDIADALLYNSCTLPNQGDEKKVMVFGVVSSEGHIMTPHIFDVGLKVNTKVYLDVLKSVMIPWCNQVADPGCGSRTRRRSTSPKRPRLGFRRSATTLYLSLTVPSSPDLYPLDYFVWSYVENITNMTSHNTKASLISATL